MNIVITGAGRGIGRAIAERFAQKEHTLFLCARTAAQLLSLKEELQHDRAGCTVHTFTADLSKQVEVEAFASFVLAHADRVDIVVNNAGHFIPGSVHNEAPGNLEQMLQVNLFSAYHLTRALLPRMMQQKAGHIFNICSIASLHAYANGGAYSISKFALLGFSKNLREEMKPYGIKVTAVCPGATLTASWDGSGIDPKRIMEAADIAIMIEAAAQLSPQAVVEDMVLRPQLGDL
jgi:short-subunit dehydrogenase